MEPSLKAKLQGKHVGRNIARVRVFKGVKQFTLGSYLGISQQEISEIEKQEIINEDLLDRIANILGVTSDVIRNFDEQAVIYNINHYDDIYNNIPTINSSSQTFQEPNDKIIDLYERLLNFLEMEKKKL